MKKALVFASLVLMALMITSCAIDVENNITITHANIATDNTEYNASVPSENTVSAPLEETAYTESISLETFSEEIEPESVIFDDCITFHREYISDENGEIMPYALYSPSTAAAHTAIPLIVWLHGSGERNVSKDIFFSRGLPDVLNNWSLEGFNAYILCPQLTLKWGYDTWYNAYAKENIQALLDKFIDTYNVDTSNIIIIGHSLGGQGALYIAHQMPEYFSKLIVLSGYNPEINISEISIPAIGYVGTAEAGEDRYSIQYMTKDFKSAFGEGNIFVLNTSHGDIPKAVFYKDDNENNRSDIVEWMFSCE